jgi:hypothetical protein
MIPDISSIIPCKGTQSHSYREAIEQISQYRRRTKGCSEVAWDPRPILGAKPQAGESGLGSDIIRGYRSHASQRIQLGRLTISLGPTSW